MSQAPTRETFCFSHGSQGDSVIRDLHRVHPHPVMAMLHTMDGIEDVVVPVSSDNDDRQYRLVRLSNGLQVPRVPGPVTVFVQEAPVRDMRLRFLPMPTKV